MIKANKLFIIFIFLHLSVGCDRNDKAQLVGDIMGEIIIFDENYYPLQDKSNVNVSLIDNATVIYLVTNQLGQFNFENIPYGDYQIDIEKEGFIKTQYDNFTVNHLEGYTPPLLEYHLFEIPKYELYIDSFEIKLAPHQSYIYHTLTENSNLPIQGYMLRYFFSQTPDVSMDNYIFHVNGYIRSDNIFALYTRAFLGDIRDDLLVKSDSVFFRAYPQAFGQALYEFYPESLGKPSNVVSFMLE